MIQNKSILFVFFIGLTVGSLAFAQDVKPRLWKDSTGQYSVLATFVNIQGNKVVLRKQDDKVISIELSKLSKDSQLVARELKKKLGVASSFVELKELESKVATAKQSVDLYKKFVANQFAKSSEVKLAREVLADLEKLANEGAIRLNGRYHSKDEVESTREKSEDAVVAALELARSKKVDGAVSLLKRTERADESSLLASFVLGMSYMQARQYSKAKTSFNKCVARGEKYLICFPEQKVNLAGAMQNIATIKVMENDFGEAAELFSRAVAIDPDLEAAAVSNLKTGIKLVELQRLNGGQPSITILHGSIDKMPNGKNLSRDTQGWCFATLKTGIPKIDNFGQESKVSVGNRLVEIDRSCTLCKGLGHVDCSNRKCTKGSVRKVVFREITMNGQTQIQRATVAEKCGTCDGKGRLTCKVCDGKRNIDFSFSGF